MRVSRTVLWEGRGEIPLPDPINHDFQKDSNKTAIIAIIIINYLNELYYPNAFHRSHRNL